MAIPFSPAPAPTPRTDKVSQFLTDAKIDIPFALLFVCRELERELAERTDSLVETAAHASKLMDERDALKVAQSSTALYSREAAALICEKNADGSVSPEWDRACRSCAHQIRTGAWDSLPPSATTAALGNDELQQLIEWLKDGRVLEALAHFEEQLRERNDIQGSH